MKKYIEKRRSDVKAINIIVSISFWLLLIGLCFGLVELILINFESSIIFDNQPVDLSIENISIEFTNVDSKIATEFYKSTLLTGLTYILYILPLLFFVKYKTKQILKSNTVFLKKDYKFLKFSTLFVVTIWVISSFILPYLNPNYVFIVTDNSIELSEFSEVVLEFDLLPIALIGCFYAFSAYIFYFGYKTTEENESII